MSKEIRSTEKKIKSTDESPASRKSNKPSKRPAESKEGKATHALNKIVKVLGTAREVNGKRRGIALQLRAQGSPVEILDIQLTASQNKAGLVDWVLSKEYDALMDMGIESLGSALREGAKDKAVVVVDFSGYHRIQVGDVSMAAYAWGGKVYFFGKTPDFKILATETAAGAVSSAGEWEEWVNAIQPIAKENPRLLACLCVSLSAAILRSFGMPAFTLALWAPTTKGKTTIQLICSSMTGLPKVTQWDGTPLGVRDVFADSPDQPRCMDDMHQAGKFEDVSQLVMATGNGAGRLVSKRAFGLHPPREIHSMPIISTEKSLASMAGSSAAAGIFARYFEVTGGQFGMFDDLCGHVDGASLSNHLKSVIEGQHGTVWPRWLKLLSRSWPKVQSRHKDRLAGLRKAILNEAGAPELDDITKRVLDNLVFAAFAGVLATKLGLWKISSVRITSAFGLLLKEHLDRTPTGNALATGIKQAIAAYIETHRDKFPSLSMAGNSDQSGHVGYVIEDHKHGTLYLFIPECFRTLFVKQYGEEVYEALRAADLIVAHSSRHNRFTKRVPIGPGSEKKPMDFIAIKAGIRFAPTQT